MSLTPKVSIITVVFNAVKSIEKTILSVLDQPYENIEFIVIDGGSKDGTINIIKKYEKRISYWVSESDEGIYDAMNKGIAVSNGLYLYFLCSGDQLKENIIKKVSNNYLNGEHHFIYGNVYHKQYGFLFNGEYSVQKLIQTNICHQAIFYKRDIFDIIGKYNVKYKILADYHFNILCFGNTNISKLYIDETIAEYEDGGISQRTSDHVFWKDFDRLILDHLGISAFILLIYYRFKKKINI